MPKKLFSVKKMHRAKGMLAVAQPKRPNDNAFSVGSGDLTKNKAKKRPLKHKAIIAKAREVAPEKLATPKNMKMREAGSQTKRLLFLGGKFKKRR